jgi:hydrogenase maturation protease
MPNLREQLQQLLQGHVCVMGLGNVAYGDDGFGVRLAEELKAEVRRPKAERSPNSEGRSEALSESALDCGHQIQIIVAGTTPEWWISRVTDEGFDQLIFLDAVEFGGLPGSVVFLNAGEMTARFPQMSTHKISLGLLAKWAEANGTTRAWLLGVQPESLKPGGELTPAVQATLELLRELVREITLEVMA